MPRHPDPADDPSSPTVKPRRLAGLTPALERNLLALQERRQAEEKRAPFSERVAERITRFTGSMLFVYIHLALFGSWIVANLGWIPGVPRWDPTFVVLGMIASVEAIFLSTFVLISQNRMAANAEKRAELDLQISLLSEHEVTKVVALVSAIAERLSIDVAGDRELDELKQDVAPEAVLDAIDATRSEETVP